MRILKTELVKCRVVKHGVFFSSLTFFLCYAEYFVKCSSREYNIAELNTIITNFNFKLAIFNNVLRSMSQPIAIGEVATIAIYASLNFTVGFPVSDRITIAY